MDIAGRMTKPTRTSPVVALIIIPASASMSAAAISCALPHDGDNHTMKRMRRKKIWSSKGGNWNEIVCRDRGSWQGERRNVKKQRLHERKKIKKRTKTKRRIRKKMMMMVKTSLVVAVMGGGLRTPGGVKSVHAIVTAVVIFITHQRRG